MKKLSLDTLVPLGVIVILAGAIAWLTSMAAKVNSSESSLNNIETIMIDMQKRLSRIEGKLENRQ
jgi:hypothetical protein